MAGGLASDYAGSYHEIRVLDRRQGLNETANITNYVSGTTSKLSAELWTLMASLAGILKVRGTLPRVFHFPPGDVMDPDEPFYAAAIVRTFQGKGSPEEIADILRLAYRAKRIGPKGICPNTAAYARMFLGIDCNAFVGNFFNLSPEIKPRGYAQGLNADFVQKQSPQWQLLHGFTEAVMLSLKCLPLKPRRTISEIRPGDVLVTVAANDNHEHIALVDSARPAGSQLEISVAEWGQAGDLSVHVTGTKTVNPVPDPKGRYGLCWQAGTSYRYFFAPPCEPNPAGWGRCGREEV